MFFDIDSLKKEVKYKTSRSSGAGGQNVNKVETKVTLLWDIDASPLFSDDQKALLKYKLNNRIQSENLLQIDCTESRSQLMNKDIAFSKLTILLQQTLTPSKKRIATKIPRSKVLARLDRKNKQAQKKSNRSWKMD